MDILIPDEWLKDFLKTPATAKQIAEYLSLSGPSVEKVENGVYSIEITTNRVDAASVLGIAREAAAILSQFGVKASLAVPKINSLSFKPKVSYLEVKLDPNLCSRFTAVLIKNVKIQDSPEWMRQRLLKVGVRPLNNVIDISNYIMHELGQPVHTFDFDKIKRAKMHLRESKKGERLTTLDGKTHKLPGGDIVIEDGEGRLIDLAGIMGGENSAVEAKTKNVLLFVQTYNPAKIRQTSMLLAQRTEAAVLFEKAIDPELVTSGIARGIELFVKLTKGTPAKEILDIYPKPYISKTIKTSLDFIRARLGIDIDKKIVTKTLASLGFGVTSIKKDLIVNVPSFRATDMNIPEDVVEEVARIYGYRNLPSHLMQGGLPEPLFDSPFAFEKKAKNILKGYGGIEVFTLSLVPKEYTDRDALKLKNPLGTETEFLRTSLRPSLIAAANSNSGEKERFHLFEMASIYLPKKGNLPEEKMILAGIFSSTEFREARGIIEAFLEELNFHGKFIAEDTAHFLPSRSLSIFSGNARVGQFGILEGGKIYYEFSLEALRKLSKPKSFKPLPKYPAQIEDLTLTFPGKTKIGSAISSIESSDKSISKVKLIDIYQTSFTFRIWYQHPTKTLIDKEVEGIRGKILDRLKKKYGAILKD